MLDMHCEQTLQKHVERLFSSHVWITWEGREIVNCGLQQLQ